MIEIILSHNIILILFVFMVVWGIARLLRINNLRKRTSENISPDDHEIHGFSSIISQVTDDYIDSAELATYASVTIAEFAWNWAAIDDAIIKAADFSSTASINNGLQFAQYIHSNFESLSESAQIGFYNRLLGYVGEQQVTDLLVSQGHIIESASTSNQPIWDLIIDGQAANIKTVSDIASIKAEAAAHSDIQYIVPEDAHGHATDNIIRLPGFNHESVKQSLGESIFQAKGESVTNGLLLHLPWVTVGFAVYRNVKAVRMGRAPVVAIKHGAADIACRGGGGVICAKFGAAIGTAIAGPVGTAFGAVIGGIIGVIAGSEVSEYLKSKPLQNAVKELESALNEFGCKFKGKIKLIKSCLTAPIASMRKNYYALDKIVSQRKKSLRWYLWPDYYTILLE